MRVLLAHVAYVHPGGEDSVFRAEAQLLRSSGLDVAALELRSESFHDIPLLERLRIACSYADHGWGRAVMRRAIQHHQPEVVHFHNLYPQLGPGAIGEAHDRGCATLQTMHNYRVTCLVGTKTRHGAPCDLCRPWDLSAGVRRGCYQGSRIKSQMVSRATARQWRDFVVDGRPLLWLTLTPYMRDLFLHLGAPSGRVLVKPNSVDAGAPLPRLQRDGVLFAGRLTDEKGILELARAWPEEAPALTIAGDGPLRDAVRATARRNVHFAGRLSAASIRGKMRCSRALVVPSSWAEGLPLVALEALSEGTPVVTFSDTSVASVASAVSPRCVVPFGDQGSLIRTASDLCSSGAAWDELSRRCVDEYRRSYTHAVNAEQLKQAYRTAIAMRGGSAG
jgi:glycosyltransferase involved in cell wall biosynthesis